MNKIDRPINRFEEFWEGQQATAAADPANAEKVLPAVKRHLKTSLILGLPFLVIGLIYAFTAPPVYRSTSSIFIDNTRLDNGDRSDIALASIASDKSIISQIELIKSVSVAEMVVNDLDLHKDSRFLKKTSLGDDLSSLRFTVANFIKTYILGAAPDIVEQSVREQHLKQKAINVLRGDMLVVQEPESFIIHISYDSVSPELAAKITNRISRAYLDDQLKANYEASIRVSKWISERVSDLNKEAIRAGLAVEQFRQRNNLFAASGRLLTENHLAAINSALLEAQTRATRLKAEIQTSKQTLKTKNIEAMLNQLLQKEANETLANTFRTQQQNLSALRKRLGDNHKTVRRATADFLQTQQQVMDAFTARIDGNIIRYDTEKRNIESIQKTLETSKGKSVLDNSKLVELREKERHYEVKQKLLESFMLRQQDAIQRGSFPVSQARIINKAAIPIFPVAPRKTFIAFISFTAGLALGGAIGFLREVGDRSFRTGDQLKKTLQIPFIGYGPYLRHDYSNSPASLPSQFMSYGSLHVTSYFTSVLRRIWVSVDTLQALRSGDGHAPERGVAVGITSAIKDEGKSVITANLASVLAHTQDRVLVIDADFKGAAIAKFVSREVANGKIVKVSDTTINSLPLHRRHDMNIDYLCISSQIDSEHESSADHSETLHEILNTAREHYSYILVDLPSMLTHAEARKLMASMDFALICVEWGKTGGAVAQKAVRMTHECGVTIIGGLLTKTSLKQLEKYESPDWRANNALY